MNTSNNQSTQQNNTSALRGTSEAHQPDVMRSEDSPAYEVTNADDTIIAKALEILASRMQQSNVMLNSPSAVKDYLRLTLAGLEHEVFSVVFLNAQHGIIATEEMFRGTLTQTSVYPREVVKRSLALNAAAVIFAHNHPSGHTDPSQSDRLLTDALKGALAMVDVRVLDHFIVAGTQAMSFAERGLL